MIVKVHETACVHDVSLIETEIDCLGLLRSDCRNIHTTCEHLSSINLDSPMEDVS